MIAAADAKHCPECGSELGSREVEERSRLYCNTCEKVIWRNPKPAAGVLLKKDDEILLIKRGNWPHIDSWSIPAGFIERDEEPVKAAARELEEETNLKISPENLQLLDNLMVKHPDGKHVIVITFTADLDKVEGELEAGDDAQDAKYWNIEELEETGEELESDNLRKFLKQHSKH
ncbi:NUDIX hydrolase [Candidatus Nanohalovita haloferacivicina]|uniref:NUDIX hydrolase n=1 Tax=Candidatus Nanohalovita haloferacivicina TaxID=2978046 RepID=UPI00325FB85F|nr:NUDIX family hydrolase [Candidatus Nanohalobia archaeon BNXNv]